MVQSLFIVIPPNHFAKIASLHVLCALRVSNSAPERLVISVDERRLAVKSLRLFHSAFLTLTRQSVFHFVPAKKPAPASPAPSRATAPKAKASAKPTLGVAQVIAFVPTKNFGQSQRFYETTLGLPLLAKDKFALMFEAGHTRIRLAKIAEFEPAPFTILGWRVDHVQETAAALAQRGVAFERFDGMKQDDHGVWTAPSGAHVAWFKDPDGNLLSISQDA